MALNLWFKIKSLGMKPIWQQIMRDLSELLTEMKWQFQLS